MTEITEKETTIQNMRNGILRNLSDEQAGELYDKLGSRPSNRRVYLKLACLAVLRYDAQGRYLDAQQIMEIGQKYLAKNVGFTSRAIGTVLGTLARMGIVNRSYNRPHTYWWRETNE